MSEAILRRQARSIFNAALKAADPFEAVLRHVRVQHGALMAGPESFSLNDFRNIYVVGAGKAGALMAKAVERLLGNRIERGLINVKYGHLARLRRIDLHECGHPIPDQNGVNGAERIAEIADAADRDDLVICLISGGASALMPAPAAPVTLDEKQETTKLLLASGATIHEINAVRKHISAIKGGQLARRSFPATVLSLILSDVIGDDLDVIGSGPTVPDLSTFRQAAEILNRYRIYDRVPASVRERIEQGLRGAVEETPKRLTRVHNVIAGSNILAVKAAETRARELGFHTMVLSTYVEGEAREIAKVHAAIARQIVATGEPRRPPACIITGGEPTVTVRGDGLGGRSQEFVLAAAIEIAGLKNVVILAGGTDGSDGPTDAAGAVADGTTVARAAELGLEPQEYLSNNDSYRFFEALGDLLITGPTNTNVMDVHLVLVGRAGR
jgi:glycerate 2-kinase